MVAAGDFEDPDAIVAMIKQHMGKCRAPDRPAETIPRSADQPHCNVGLLRSKDVKLLA